MPFPALFGVSLMSQVSIAHYVASVARPFVDSFNPVNGQSIAFALPGYSIYLHPPGKLNPNYQVSIWAGDKNYFDQFPDLLSAMTRIETFAASRVILIDTHTAQ